MVGGTRRMSIDRNRLEAVTFMLRELSCELCHSF